MNIGSDTEQSKQAEERGWVGHNCEKYFIGLFHVSEHLDHFKAIQKKVGKKRKLFCGSTYPPWFGKRPNYFRFFLMKASLKESLKYMN